MRHEPMVHTHYEGRQIYERGACAKNGRPGDKQAHSANEDIHGDPNVEVLRSRQAQYATGDTFSALARVLVDILSTCKPV